jgi:hypothetical protein
MGLSWASTLSGLRNLPLLANIAKACAFVILVERKIQELGYA